MPEIALQLPDIITVDPDVIIDDLRFPEYAESLRHAETEQGVQLRTTWLWKQLYRADGPDWQRLGVGNLEPKAGRTAHDALSESSVRGRATYELVAVLHGRIAEYATRVRNERGAAGIVIPGSASTLGLPRGLGVTSVVAATYAVNDHVRYLGAE